MPDALTPFRTLQHRFEHWLFDWPETTGNRAIQLVATPLRYAYALLRDLFGGDLGLRAMGLVYSSLFALVPVVAVSFAVLKAFGYHRELEPVLAEFLRPLGEKGIELTVKFMQFVENAQTTVLGTVGFVIPVYTVIVMIERSRARSTSLARRAPAQPGPARHRIHDHHGGRTSPDGCRDGAADAHRDQRHGGASLGAGRYAGSARSLRALRADHRAVLVPVQLHAEHARALASGVHRRPVRWCCVGWRRRDLYSDRRLRDAGRGDLCRLRDRAAVHGVAAPELADHAARRTAELLRAAP
ncbi:MAG: YihY/virulence factor BrkB family protein [Proteobacteria bacterium]|nr:YihY/virulence factor BrkB family protein [Pseudomonadota bacterium]